MPVYQYRCPHPEHRGLIEQFHSMSSYPRAVACPVHGTTAGVIISRSQFFHVDNTDRIDYTPMAGTNFNTKRERDAWLERENRWIPEADDPRMKEAFAYLEHQKQEQADVEARGGDWAEHLRDKKRQEDEAINQQMAANGISITPMTSAEANRKLADKAARGKGDARWFQQKMSLLPPGADPKQVLPEVPEPPDDLEWPE